MVSHILETDLSVPTRKGQWWYYSRTIAARSYPIHCRCPAQEGSPPPLPESGSAETPLPGEQVILDENALAEATGASYLAIGSLEMSPDHTMAAYSMDTSGEERYLLRIREVQSGTELIDEIADTYYGIAWSSDSSTVFYVRPDTAMRPFQLWRHRLGTDQSEDQLVYQEDDERFYMSVGCTADEQYLVMELHSKLTSEAWVAMASDPEGDWVVVEPRRHGVEYHLEHHLGPAPAITEEQGGFFVILTNDNAENFRLVAAPETSPGSDHWRDIVPHRADVRLEAVQPFAGHLVLQERADAELRLEVIDCTTGSTHVIAQPEHPCSMWTGTNLEFSTTNLRYEWSSLVTPRSVIDYDLVTRTATLLKRQVVLGDFDPSRYRTERLWATATDGTRVPISLVYKAGRLPGEPSPALLYGYGSYEVSTDPVFSSLRLSLLDRGVVFAIAHVRGGGEMGRHWYESGKLLKKRNTFTDFIACARLLIEEGWTSPGMLVARGGSAGGLLMGAVANIAPEMLRAVVAEVPFVDCLTTMLDPSLPLTVTEWEEWGNPLQDKQAYDYIKSYSPYDNISRCRYPDILATGGLGDPRVGFWEPAKWVAKLREAHPENRVLFKVELGAGHQGPSGRYDTWMEEALVYAFILDAVRIDS